MATRDRNLGKPEVFVPPEGGLWTCPECGTTNPHIKRICEGCGQLARFQRTPAGVYPGAFFILSAIALFAVCTAQPYAAGPLRNPGYVALALVAIGLYFLWKRPTGKQYAREVRERDF